MKAGDFQLAAHRQHQRHAFEYLIDFQLPAFRIEVVSGWNLQDLISLIDGSRPGVCHIVARHTDQFAVGVSCLVG